MTCYKIAGSGMLGCMPSPDDPHPPEYTLHLDPKKDHLTGVDVKLDDKTYSIGMAGKQIAVNGPDGKPLGLEKSANFAAEHLDDKFIDAVKNGFGKKSLVAQDAMDMRESAQAAKYIIELSAKDPRSTNADQKAGDDALMNLLGNDPRTKNAEDAEKLKKPCNDKKPTTTVRCPF